MAVDGAGVDIIGLKDLRRSLGKVDKELPKELRQMFLQVGNRIAGEARAKVPRVSGRAAGSIKAGMSGARAYVQGGKKTVPYYAWLDFGGGIPNKRNRGSNPPRVSRPFLKEGRYLYPTVKRHRPEIVRESVSIFERLAKEHAVRNPTA